MKIENEATLTPAPREWVILLAFALTVAAFAQAAAQNESANPAYHEVWIALRADGQAGTGAVNDPFDAGSPEKLNALFEEFAAEYGDNLTVHFGPGIFEGTHRWSPRNHWKIRGVGRDVTILRTRADPNAIETVGFRGETFDDGRGPNGFEMSDLTVDFNTPNLRKANRVLLTMDWAGVPRVSYFYLEGTPAAWRPETEYKAHSLFLQQTEPPVAVRHKGQEYVVAKASCGQEPGDNEWWRPLRALRAAELPAWAAGRAYARGEAAAKDGKGFICLAVQTTADPAAGADWQAIDPSPPDPMIYTHAAAILSPAGGGRNRVERVRVINGNGSRFLDREAFMIGLGGDNCVIEDCEVDLFRGDYSTCLAIFCGSGSVIRGCTVIGNGGWTNMGYGGWRCSDAVFEGNVGRGLAFATNIDSLVNRNCIFRDNIFLGCHMGGILVNMDGKPCAAIPSEKNIMDGVIIHDNLVELAGSSILGAIQTQGAGLTNARIYNNTLRAVDGKGKGRRAIGVWGEPRDVEFSGNVCDPGMRADLSVPVRGQGNHDFQGNPIKGLESVAGVP